MAKVKNINMAPDTIPPYMKLSQYDVGRVIDFVMKEDSADYTVPAGATITLEGKKPSGLGFTIACTVGGNVAAIETTAGMTDEAVRMTARAVLPQKRRRKIWRRGAMTTRDVSAKKRTTNVPEKTISMRNRKVAIRSLKHRSSLQSTRFPTIEISTRKQSLENALSLM